MHSFYRFDRIPEIDDPRLDQVYIDNVRRLHKLVYPDMESIAKNVARYRQGELATVLDIGCGHGSLAHAIAKQLPGTRVIGIDTDPQILKLAHELMDTAKTPNLELKVGDVHDLEEYSGQVDYIVSLNAFHHFENPVLALTQMWDSLNEKGVFSIQDFNREYLDEFSDEIVLPSGNSVNEVEGIYELRKKLSDQECADLFFSHEFYPHEDNHESKMNLIKISSYMACYVLQELAIMTMEHGINYAQTRKDSPRKLSLTASKGGW